MTLGPYEAKHKTIGHLLTKGRILSFGLFSYFLTRQETFPYFKNIFDGVDFIVNSIGDNCLLG